ncbi:putative RNA methyltransferase [Marinobacter sp. S0848L]|uniref:putative RNA methyltransferase n=1 Tax=Marinobacter sp. S0848L TaxID=2926423 RepID=UPI001FF63863|nr:methyltransferase domain-containing protein [Marinobacter sp. S0848L]MCK0107389.1 methyltransferase domain-containing protein [Marinobacter sp. S0848L]
MSVVPFEHLACPLDSMPLCREEKSWRCKNGHSFDVARQGYVHLLPVQKKRSKDPGDSKAMVAARQRFLEAGFYQPIADAVTKAALADTANQTTMSCLDAGCGEGYYLRQLGQSSDDIEWSELGLDISKWAVLSGAKQDRRANWVVGSNANLPVGTDTLDRVLCLFGFPVYSEFARVLRSGGLLIQVDAGQDHLRELREIIYPEVRAESKKVASAPQGFRRTASEDVRFPLHLAGAEAIADLLAMTPHLYRASQEGRARAAALESLSLTVDVCLHTFERL